MPHPIEFCYGSPHHCWSHNEDEHPDTSYRWCLECGHTFATAAELIEDDYNVRMFGWTHFRENGEPQPVRMTDADKIFCCPHCTHDW